MTTNTVTTVDQLHLGDRFYKSGDKKKRVFTKVEPTEIKKTHFQNYKHMALMDGMMHPVYLKATTSVVFLRHAL